MQQNNRAEPDDQWLNAAGAAFFACTGLYTIFEAQKFEGSGAVTPIFIGIGLVTLSIILLAVTVLKPKLIPKIELSTGSINRRLAMAVVLVVWVGTLPISGFLPSSVIAFALITAIVPTQASWTINGVAFHAICGCTIIFLFWYVLTTFLNVPLPQGILFG